MGLFYSNHKVKFDSKSFFKDTIKIVFQPKDGLVIPRKEIVDGLRIFDDLSISNIKRITQFKNNYTWLITIEDYDISTIMSKSIYIHEQLVKIESPYESAHNDSGVLYTFKIMYAPPNFPLDKIEEHLKCGTGKLIRNKEVFVNEPGYETIGCGIYNITIKYALNAIPDMLKIVGMKVICGQKILITRYGKFFFLLDQKKEFSHANKDVII
jgi:hypothetical protein